MGVFLKFRLPLFLAMGLLVPWEAAQGQPPLRLGDLRTLDTGSAADLKERPAAWNWTEPVIKQAAAPPDGAQSSEPVADLPDEEGAGDLLDEVAVTATRRPVRQRDTTATTYSVRQEDFRAVGATTASDALQLVPGFQAVPSFGGIRIGGIFLRGFDDSRFQLLRDGLLLNRSSSGAADLVAVQLVDLERIEVVTGGATLRYGSGAVGGVINLITETPKGQPRLRFSYETGSYGFSRYTAKFGGDDTFNYNLTYGGIVAFNDYPFSYTLPNQALFYGPTSNPAAQAPAAINPAGYPNGQNSFGLGGAAAADPANRGPIDLYGFLKPEVGPPIKVQGVADAAQAASDNYSAKLTFKPDPFNKLTLRLDQQNRFYLQTPSTFGNSFPVCQGGPSAAANPTLNGDQFFPVDEFGNLLSCDQQRYTVATPSSVQAGGPYPYNIALGSGAVFPTGQAYPLAEASTQGGPRAFQRIHTSQTQAALYWDHEISPTTSLNSYAYFLRLAGNQFTPDPFYYNTNLQQSLGTSAIPGLPGQRTAPPNAQPAYENGRFEIQTALNTKLSPGQDLSFGLNFLEDRSYQQRSGGRTFFDKAIARYAAFLIDDISFSDQLKANIGLRYTSNSAFGELLSPAAGVRYSPTSFLSLRANWSQVFNAPSLTNLFVAGAGVIPNPDLKPETGVTYDVGVDITPARNLGFRLTYFNTYLDGAIGTAVFRNPDPTSQFRFLSQTRNLDSRLASGIELTADWQLSDQWRLRAIWSNTDARNYGPPDSPDQSTYPYFYQYQDPNIPFNSVLVNAVYQNRGLLASLVGRYDSGKRRFNSLDFVPAWFSLDLNVELPIAPNFILTGSVFNLLDSQYEFRDGAPAPGTTFRLGGRVEIGG